MNCLVNQTMTEIYELMNTKVDSQLSNCLKRSACYLLYSVNMYDTCTSNAYKIDKCCVMKTNK